jgi:hypothetical protein
MKLKTLISSVIMISVTNSWTEQSSSDRHCKNRFHSSKTNTAVMYPAGESMQQICQTLSQTACILTLSSPARPRAGRIHKLSDRERLFDAFS